MKKIFFPLISVIIALFIFSGCKLAGLDLQKDTPFDASLRDSKINLNALEFMKSRTDLFSSMIEGVTYAGLLDDYTKPDRTFLLLTNRALADETYASSYFASNKLPNPLYNPAIPANGPQLFTPDNWSVYPVDQVKRFFMYHIVKEPVTYRNAKAFSTFYESLAYQAAGDTTKVSFHLTNDRNAYLYVNGFVGSRNPALAPRTSGIDCANGVIHVMDDFIIPPTRIILGNK